MRQTLATVSDNKVALAGLAQEINKQHGLAESSVRATFDHAVRAGQALIAAKAAVPFGAWTGWMRQNLKASEVTAQAYMRLADNESEIREALEAPTLTSALRILRGRGITSSALDHRRSVIAQSDVEDAKTMLSEGKSRREVAAHLRVSTSTVDRWTNVNRREADRQRMKRLRQRRKEAEKALQLRERDQAIKQAVRKAGVAVQEAWAMAERMQDVLAQAQRETQDRQARAALSSAGEHYRKMRDEIVRALGVA